MEVRYTDHAKEKMVERAISEALVHAVLANPQWMPATARGVRYDAIVDGERWCVVVDERADPTIVITVFPYIERERRRG